jgi:hypothetical protein
VQLLTATELKKWRDSLLGKIAPRPARHTLPNWPLWQGVHSSRDFGEPRAQRP